MWGHFYYYSAQAALENWKKKLTENWKNAAPVQLKSATRKFYQNKAFEISFEGSNQQECSIMKNWMIANVPV